MKTRMTEGSETDLFNIKRNQVTMILDRGYDIADEVNILDPNFELSTFVDHYTTVAKNNSTSFREALLRIYQHKTTPNRFIFVYYAQVPPKASKLVSIGAANTFIQLCEKNDVTDAIFIAPTELSPSAKTVIESSVRRTIQIFFDYELRFNPTKHILVPLHELISPKEAKELLQKWRASKSQLPIILDKDPIVKYYSWPVGSIIKLHQRDILGNTMTEYEISYRVILTK